MMRGEIEGLRTDEDVLRALGVEVVSGPEQVRPGSIRSGWVRWQVRVTDEVLARLDGLWGRFIWLLEGNDDARLRAGPMGVRGV